MKKEKTEKLQITAKLKLLIDKKINQYTGEYFDNSHTFIGREIQSNILAYQYSFETYNLNVEEERTNIQNEYARLRQTNSLFNYTYSNLVTQKGDLLQAVQFLRKYWCVEQSLVEKQSMLYQAESQQADFLRELDKSNHRNLLRQKFTADDNFWHEISVLEHKSFQKAKVCGVIVGLIIFLLSVRSLILNGDWVSIVIPMVIGNLCIWVGIFGKWDKNDRDFNTIENEKRIMDYVMTSKNYRLFQTKAIEKTTELQTLEQWRKGKKISLPNILCLAPELQNILQPEYMNNKYISMAENCLLSGRCETMKELGIYLDDERYKAEQLAIQRMILAEQQRVNNENIRIAKERAAQEKRNQEEMLRVANEQMRATKLANEKMLAEQKKANTLAKETRDATKRAAEYEERSYYNQNK